MYDCPETCAPQTSEFSVFGAVAIMTKIYRFPEFVLTSLSESVFLRFFCFVIFLLIKHTHITLTHIQYTHTRTHK